MVAKSKSSVMAVDWRYKIFMFKTKTKTPKILPVSPTFKCWADRKNLWSFSFCFKHKYFIPPVHCHDRAFAFGNHDRLSLLPAFMAQGFKKVNFIKFSFFFMLLTLVR